MKNPARKKIVPGALPALLIAVVLLTVSAAVGCAAEGAHHADSSAQLKDFGYRLLNFAILVALLVWAAKKADIKGLLAARRADVEKALREADEIRYDAELKLAEYSEKLEKATLEIEQIQASIRQDGVAEKNRIIADAKQTAERIREQAKLAARQEVETAKAQLRAETARLSVQLAEATLKQSVTPSDQDRFVDEYLNKVVEA